MIFFPSLGVIPVLVGPLQALFAVLPGILIAIGGVVVAAFRPSAIRKGFHLLWRLKFSVLAVVAVVVGVTLLVRAIAPGSPSYQTMEGSQDDWPMFRGGLERRASVPGVQAPRRGGVNWAFDKEAKTFYSSPAVVGNRLYATSAEVGVFSDRGAIYCLDADSGGVVWKTSPDGYRATFSSPAIVGDRLVCGEGLHLTRDARVFCIDISEAGAGRVLWQYRTKSHVESSPCIADGRVYIGAGADGYYCFELEPDEAGQARLVWHVAGEEYADAETSPAVFDGKVFVGLGVDGNAVLCLDAATGREIWRVRTPYPVFGPPTVAHGRVFVGMGTGNFIQRAEEVAQIEEERLRTLGASEAEIADARVRLRPAGEVWGIDIDNPENRWSLKLEQNVLGAVVAGPERLFFGSSDGFFYAASFDGRILGKRNVHEPIRASPAYAEDTVYCVTVSGVLYALESSTLEPLWSVTLGQKGLFLSSPAIARGRVYVGSENSGLLCLGEPELRKESTYWAGYPEGLRTAGRSAGLLPDRGELLCRYPKARDPAAAITVTAPAAAQGDRLLVPWAGASRKGLACLFNDPKPRGDLAEKWFFTTPHGIRLSPAADMETVFVVDGVQGDADRRLYALDGGTGQLKWSLPVAAEASGEFVLSEHGLYIESEAETLISLSAEGAVRWQRKTGPLRGAVAVRGDLLAAVVLNPSTLVLMDRETGERLWAAALDAAPRTAPVLRGRRLYIGTESGVEARDLVDGRQLWRTGDGNAGGALVCEPPHVAYVNAASEVILLSAEDGKVEKVFGGGLPGAVPLLARDSVLFLSGAGLMRYVFGAEEPDRWMDVEWLGPITSPLVLVDSRVYFATEQRGLVRTGSMR